MGQGTASSAKKIIPFPVDRKLGADELNICEFPLCVAGRNFASDVKTLKFEDDIFDEGRGKHIHRSLTVSGSDAFGLPTPVDSDVLLVLMHLTNMQNTFTKAEVKFTRYELVNMLGWSHGGHSYKRLEESLNRWASVTLYYGQAWWDKAGRKWRSTTFHVIESVDLRGRATASEDVESSFVWNHVIFDSFKANHIKRLDLDTYFALKSPAARQAYRFLDKRFYRARVLRFDLRTFACEHVGLSRSYDNSQMKRKLGTALAELEEIGFLEPQDRADRFHKVRRGQWQITLIRAGQGAAIEVQDEEEENGGLLHELVKRGVHETIARQIVRDTPEEKIQQKIRVHDWLLEKKGSRRPKNPAGYLAASIRNDYPAPKDYVEKRATNRTATKTVRKRKAQAKRPAADKPHESAEVDAKKRAAFDKLWSSLSGSAQQDLEAKAMDELDSLTVSVCDRLRRKGGRMWDEMRQSVLCRHAEKSGLLRFE